MSWFKRFSVFLILLILVSTFVAVLHHHENTADDHDCPICVVSHHLSASGQSPVEFDGVPFITETTYVAPRSVLTDIFFVSLLSNRAPPA